jgi:hypothetical protein
MSRGCRLTVATTLILLIGSVSAGLRGQVEHRKLRRAAEGSIRLERRFIVVLKPEVGYVRDKARSLLRESGAGLEFTYENSIKGFAVSGLVTRVLLRILNDDMVDYIEEVR